MTADPAALLRLAADIEALEGPDREMDAWVAEAFGHKVEWRSARYTQEMTPVISWQTPHPCAGMREQCPRYTDSVDAALRLMREALPGWVSIRTTTLHSPTGQRSSAVEIRPMFDEQIVLHCAEAPTLPLAICAAVLRGYVERSQS